MIGKDNEMQIISLTDLGYQIPLSSLTQISMRVTLIFIFLSVLCLPVQSQSASITASISLSAPAPSCSFSRQSQLNYGTLEKPASGSASVVINAQTGARTSTGSSAGGPSSVGHASLAGSNVANYTVLRSFPSNLTNSSDQLTFSGAWSQSSSSGSGYTAISGASYSGSAGGAGTSFTHHFRFGGTVSGIDINDANGTYTGTISATGTCN